MTVTVSPDEDRYRLDRLLASRFPDRSRSYLQKLIRDGHVTLHGGGPRAVRPSRVMVRGEQLLVAFPAPARMSLQPEALPLSILYEDDQIIVLDKPSGLVVHPGAGTRGTTLVHALLHHCRDLSGIGGVERPGIVHRLDKVTSGVMVVAKTDAAHRSLSAQFAARTVRKTYVALVWGLPLRASGTIDVPIGRDARSRVRISSRTGRPRAALTDYRVVETLGGLAWLEVSPRTGRTHQIRVHLKLIGHPIVGDATYGGVRWRQVDDPVRREALERFGRLALHARRVEFAHPSTGRSVSFEAPVPPDLEWLLETLRRA